MRDKAQRRWIGVEFFIWGRRMKKFRAFFIAITLLFMCGGISFSVYAGVNHSQSEAVAWISARKAEGWAQDYDKDTFTSVPQCVDLITKTSHTYNGIAL